MNLSRTWISVVTVVCGVLLTQLAYAQTDASYTRSQTKGRARNVMSQVLPALDRHHLKAVLVEVRYGPGEASVPHSHPCAVVGYVVKGSLRTQVQGQPEAIYRVGQSFYEAPNGVHLISGNASSTESAKFLAYFICDRDTPLTVDLSKRDNEEGASR